jgi:hypothetical protein
MQFRVQGEQIKNDDEKRKKRKNEYKENKNRDKEKIFMRKEKIYEFIKNKKSELPSSLKCIRNLKSFKI